ncbi:MAG: thioesterase family protein [Cyanobacteria bacterium J06627_28]
MSNMPLSAAKPWFEYPIRVQPHHTDYGGVVWHGTYITWMESARVECLRAAGTPFETLVALGYDLPVVGLDIRYRKPLSLGMEALVKTRLVPSKGVRLNWQYEIVSIGASADGSPELCVTGQVSLVTVKLSDRTIVRRLPPEVKTIVERVTAQFSARPD